ncbi:MAG: acyl carrier protein [Halioglobus sp.]|nr:acyl carrier protein [Halioglobus sp.]
MDIRESIRSYILAEFLPGEDPANLEDTTPLIASGILDSLATMRLVGFIEEEFSVEIGPHETDPEYIGTIDSIERLVRSKLDGAR